jgi:hypothetical protein
MKTFAVAIPVIRAVFDVEVVERSRLLPLDVLLLTAISRNIETSGDLAEEFRLVPRLVEASLIRLIEEDLVFLELETGKLQLTDSANAAWREGAMEGLAFRGEPQTERMTVVSLPEMPVTLAA